VIQFLSNLKNSFSSRCQKDRNAIILITNDSVVFSIGIMAMDQKYFWAELERCIAKYDLLKHPFYTAWSNGELTKEDLRTYAFQYYPHVEAFPNYLQELEKRLPNGELRTTIEDNRQDELGSKSASGISHSDMWLDFAYGMGADKEEIKSTDSIPEIKQLMSQFYTYAKQGDTIEALAAFYAYESQVPRIADEKAAGLRNKYGADTKTCRYFAVHSVADIEHANTWRQLINKEIDGDTDKMQLALKSVEKTAAALWKVLDGILPLTSVQTTSAGSPCVSH
jgi:pyrroloquinoline-quinone synthase